MIQKALFQTLDVRICLCCAFFDLGLGLEGGVTINELLYISCMRSSKENQMKDLQFICCLC